ncbi:MAG: hypothetical protein GC160_06605 [Acidobacteria bacterium]|nr:hypothetical protein [Acidobacteriota bacterium]
MVERPTRFEISKPVEYTVRSQGGAVEGAGRTVNISRRGVLFESKHPIALGRRVELIVDMGDDMGAPTNLHIQGIAVRNQDGTVAVAIKKYKLRAPGSPA